jgi:hypothetical protein
MKVLKLSNASIYCKNPLSPATFFHRNPDPALLTAFSKSYSSINFRIITDENNIS